MTAFGRLTWKGTGEVIVEPVAKPAMVFWAGFFYNRSLVSVATLRGG
jgi:hypothetical protein